jgi:uncharacterized membrane protein YdbT with pleckstrin-like domain
MHELNTAEPAHTPGLLRPAMVEANAAAGHSAYAEDQAIPVHLLDGGEIVELKIKPSLWFIVFASFRTLLAMVAVVAVSYPLSRALGSVHISEALLIKTATGVAVARLVVAALQWVSRLYVLTNRRIMRIRGVFNVDIFECQLTRIQNTYLSLAIYERLLGLGSIGFATAGTGGVEAIWENINHPMEVHERVRAAIARSQRGRNDQAL